MASGPSKKMFLMPPKRPVAIAAVIGLSLLATAIPAEARNAAITGKLDHPSYTVVALASNGASRSVRAGHHFKLVPPARVVTLQLLDANGGYRGPVIVGGRGKSVIMGVRAGARLGRIRIHLDFATTLRKVSSKSLAKRHTAKARHGVPIGVGVGGLVLSSRRGPPGPGRDQDHDGIPGLFDADDNGDLVPDKKELAVRPPARKRARSPAKAGTPARKRAGSPAKARTPTDQGAGSPAKARTPARKRTGSPATARTPTDQGAGSPARAPASGTTSASDTAPASESDTTPASAAGDPVNDDTANAALVVAICAAAAALLSLLVQLLSWVRRRRRRVEVEMSLVLPVNQRADGQWAVFIEVANRTEQPLRWTSADLELRDGRRLRLAEYPPGGELPAVVQADESHRTWATCAALERSGLDLREPLVATVGTANGKVFHSKVRKLKKPEVVRA
jgi:hypothetical protein